MAVDYLEPDDSALTSKPLPLHPYSIAAANQADHFREKDLSPVILGSHLFLGLLVESRGAAGKFLRDLGLKPEDAHVFLQQQEQASFPTSELLEQQGQIIEHAFKRANHYALVEGCETIETRHLLRGILEVDRAELRPLFESLDLNYQQALLDLTTVTSEQTPPSQSVPGVSSFPIGPTLERYGRNLTQLARQDKLEPVIGREEEIQRLMEILSRRSKNNALLIGPAGSGKTAIVEGLAQRLLEENLEGRWHSVQLIDLSLENLLAGTKLRGEFEERVKKIIKEVESNPDVILFIDEMHKIIGASAGAGPGIADSIKPALARGKLRCIGATTPKEARIFEKDQALQRRFQPVIIEPPTREQTVEILTGVQKVYEDYHHVVIPHTTILAAVDASGRYIKNRIWPDSAIDALDEACVRAKRVKSDTPPTVTERHVAEVISMQTGIPVGDIIQSEGAHLLQAEKQLQLSVIGQDQAVGEVVRALRRARAGLRDPQRPLGSFLFLGPTGVGKTHLATQLAQYMFGEKDHLIRIDMSEFQSAHNVSRLIGSPPGYVGYQEGGTLTEALRRNPYSVLLLDEIEKAHPDVWKLLLQLLDYGKISDASGQPAYASNCIVIATSNVGSQLQHQSGKLGFSTALDHSTSAFTGTDWKRAAESVFSPELLGRLVLVPFPPLSLPDLCQIAGLEAQKVVTRLQHEHGLQLNIDHESLLQLVKDSDCTTYGARAVKRQIQKQLEEPLTHWLLQQTSPLNERTISWKLHPNPSIEETRAIPTLAQASSIG